MADPYLGFTQTGLTNWGADQLTKEHEIINCLVADCLEQEYRAQGHRHTKLYNGYGTSLALSSVENDVSIGESGFPILNLNAFLSGTLSIKRNASGDTPILAIDEYSDLYTNKQFEISSHTTVMGFDSVSNYSLLVKRLGATLFMQGWIRGIPTAGEFGGVEIALPFPINIGGAVNYQAPIGVAFSTIGILQIASTNFSGTRILFFDENGDVAIWDGATHTINFNLTVDVGTGDTPLYS